MAPVNPAVRTLFRTATVFALFAVIMGSVVCATDSGFECGNWPGCTDHTLLPKDAATALLYKNPWIEMIHRTSAIVAGPLALACAIVSLRLKGVHPSVKVLPWLSVFGAIVAGVVGRGIVLGAVYPTWVGAFDLFSALLCLAGLLLSTVALEKGARRFSPTSTGALAWTLVGVLVVSHLIALWTARLGSYTRCMSWPVWAPVEGDDPALTLVRYVLHAVALALVLLVAARLRARRPTLAGVLVGLAALVLALGLAIGYAHVTWLGFVFSALTTCLLATALLVAARESYTGDAPGTMAR